MSRPINQTDAFRGIAHPVRRRILDLLSKGERTAGDIVAEFQFSQPTVSQHLQVLLQTRLVTQRRQANRRVYRINRSRIRLLQNWMSRVS